MLKPEQAKKNHRGNNAFMQKHGYARNEALRHGQGYDLVERPSSARMSP